MFKSGGTGVYQLKFVLNVSHLVKQKPCRKCFPYNNKNASNRPFLHIYMNLIINYYFLYILFTKFLFCQCLTICLYFFKSCLYMLLKNLSCQCGSLLFFSSVPLFSFPFLYFYASGNHLSYNSFPKTLKSSSVVDPDGSVSFGRFRIRIVKWENGSGPDPGTFD